MRKTVMFIFIILLSAVLHAQEFSPSLQLAPRSNKISILTTTGVNVFGSRFGTGSSYYVMPSLAYKISPRLTVTSGIGYMHTNFSSAGEMNTPFSNNVFMFRTSALYQVNERLTVYGSVYKTMDNSPQPMMNPRANNFNSHGTTMGFIYKVTDNIRLGIEFRQRTGSPYMNPYGNPYNYGSPFSGPMFGQPW